jgi:hypothetical protein
MTISEAADSLGKSADSLGKYIASPAKLAFIGYVVLVYGNRITTSKWEFFAVVAVFLFLQVWHDDYLRIRLNKHANRT